MKELVDHLTRCTVKATSMSPSDLAGLVSLHTDLLATKDFITREEVEGSGDLVKLLGSIETVATCVERFIVNESANDSTSINEIATQISQLQELISGKTVLPAAHQKTVTESKPALFTASAPAAITSERKIAETDVPLALEFVSEAASHLEAAEASLLKLADDPSNNDEVNAVFRAFHTVKGVAGFLELKQIGALAHVAETLLDLARKGKLLLAGNILDVVLEARDVMGKMVLAVEAAAKSLGAPAKQEGLEALIQRLGAAAQGESVGAAAVKAPSERATEPSASGPTNVDEATVNEPSSGEPDNSPKQTNTVAGNASGSTSEGVVKVATGRLDTLVSAVGELVIAQAMVTQDLSAAMLTGNQRLARNLSHLGKITRGLQELSMSMRMVPIAGVFQKMARLTRDISRKAGKEAEFIQIGGETELDRNVVEAISDPLVHMVRNSLDHGLECPEDRIKAGKPRTGRLTLRAGHQGGNIVIEITDDGRGLNQQRIVQKALAAGIIKEGQELSEQQIFQLIFHAGLSTAEKITEISGRGVGMDVVKKNVEALRGRIEIASTPGQGSTFTVRLPLTLAVIDGLIVRVGRERYILPITSIEQSIRPTAGQLSSVRGKGEICMVRDRLLPIVRLHELFHVEPTTKDPTQALVVIVQDGADRCCLLVDEVVSQQQVVIKSVGKEIGELPGIAGCAILGDGNVSLILDVAGIMHSALK